MIQKECVQSRKKLNVSVIDYILVNLTKKKPKLISSGTTVAYHFINEY